MYFKSFKLPKNTKMGIVLLRLYINIATTTKIKKKPIEMGFSNTIA